VLESLYIKNFGLIEQAEIEFGPGLNSLTGETGTGKTIVLEALKASLGNRTQTDMIRTGQDRAVVQATFDLTKIRGIEVKLRNYGLAADIAEDDLLVLSREINRQGRNICRVNGRVVNLGVYRSICESLVEIQGQHEQQTLLSADIQMQLLDRFGGPELHNLLQETANAYREWNKVSHLREDLISGSRDRQQRKDLLSFQLKEIDSADLTGVDENELLSRRNLLANAEKIISLGEQAIRLIYSGNNHSPAAVDLLGESKNLLEELCHYDPETKSYYDNIYSALCLVEETARELAAYRESIELDPRELDFLEERLALIEQLKRKYGDSIGEILAYRDQVEGELEKLELSEIDASGIEKLEADALEEYTNLANQLEKSRLRASLALKKEVERELRFLAMNSVEFEVKISQREPGPDGHNFIEYLISPNPGEPLKPMSKIASGGELSRIILAIKSILASNDEVCTLVFDEVDTGIGGQTLQAVAEKLEQLGHSRQVICVTHAAVIAASASIHHLISKEDSGDKTFTHIHRLDGEDRIRELSRMLGGDSNSENLIQYARKIIKS